MIFYTTEIIKAAEMTHDCVDLVAGSSVCRWCTCCENVAVIQRISFDFSDLFDRENYTKTLSNKIATCLRIWIFLMLLQLAIKKSYNKAVSMQP